MSLTAVTPALQINPLPMNAWYAPAWDVEVGRALLPKTSATSRSSCTGRRPERPWPSRTPAGTAWSRCRWDAWTATACSADTTLRFRGAGRALPRPRRGRAPRGRNGVRAVARHPHPRCDEGPRAGPSGSRPVSCTSTTRRSTTRRSSPSAGSGSPGTGARHGGTQANLPATNAPAPWSVGAARRRARRARRRRRLHPS
jgi:hypothetical protein